MVLMEVGLEVDGKCDGVACGRELITSRQMHASIHR